MTDVEEGVGPIPGTGEHQRLTELRSLFCEYLKVSEDDAHWTNRIDLESCTDGERFFVFALLVTEVMFDHPGDLVTLEELKDLLLQESDVVTSAPWLYQAALLVFECLELESVTVS